MSTIPAGGSPGLRLTAVRRSGGRIDQDVVVVEEPLEIRLDGRPLVVTMRTPGHDAELAAGFLHAEGIIARGADIASIRVVAGDGAAPAAAGSTRMPGARFAGDRVEVVLAAAAGAGADAGGVPDPSGAGAAAGGVPDPSDPGAGADAGGSGAAAARDRPFAATAACGVCGKASIDDLARMLPAIAPGAGRPALPDALPDALLDALPGRLRARQTLFHATGGLHAAGLFTFDGELRGIQEDIGRHNAVDKVIGEAVLRQAVPLADRILVVSGRAGFELVQKALQASIPAMVAVGAASSIAVDMAAAAGMILYSFAGRGRGNLHVAAPPAGRRTAPAGPRPT